jgi:hypothetical protein
VEEEAQQLLLLDLMAAAAEVAPIMLRQVAQPYLDKDFLEQLQYKDHQAVEVVALAVLVKVLQVTQMAAVGLAYHSQYQDRYNIMLVVEVALDTVTYQVELVAEAAALILQDMLMVALGSLILVGVVAAQTNLE